jgi:2-oxoglutarate ferredoxin oxidoreductase subunit alpha
MNQLQDERYEVGHAHLNYLNPFPRNTAAVLANYENVLIPELNMGQLLNLIRFNFPKTNAVGLNKVQGLPFKVQEIKDKAKEILS